MAKEVTKKTENAVEKAGSLGAWGVQPTVSRQDLLLSKLMLMQGLSDMVANGEAKLGEIRDSVTEELYALPDAGTAGGEVELIPFFCQKFWRRFKLVDHHGKPLKKPEYIEKVEVVDDPTDPNYNADWEWETSEERNDYTYDFFVMIPGMPIPKVVSFSRTSAQAGKKMFNQMYILNPEQGLVPPAYKMILSSRKITGENNYAAFNIRRGEKANDHELSEAFKYYKQIVEGLKSNSVKVDESDT